METGFTEVNLSDGEFNSDTTQKSSTNSEQSNPFTRGTDRNDISEVGDTETKRRRGRPKGSKNRTEENIFQGQVGQTEVKKGRPKKQKTEDAEKFISTEEAQQISTLILAVIEQFGINLVGEDGRYSPIESTILNASLPAYLSTMKKSTVQKVSAVAYPVAILAGFSMYGIRLGNIKKEQNLAKTQEILSNQNIEYTINENQPIAEDKPTWTVPQMNTQF
jgi:hypothetical protein